MTRSFALASRVGRKPCACSCFNMATKPLCLPRVIEFAFRGYRADAVTKSRGAECRTCGRTVKEKAGTTSNFLRHLRKHHPPLYELYQESKKQAGPLPPIPNANTSTATTDKPRPTKVIVVANESSTTKRQAITNKVTATTKITPNSGKTKENSALESLVNLIVEESLPIEIVESQGFNNYLKKVSPKSKPISYEATRTELIRRSAKIWADIWKRLSASASVNATVDVWSDEGRKFFIAVTAHLIEEHQDGLKLSSLMLSCQRVIGRNGGDEIASAFARIVGDFSIERKLNYIIVTDAPIAKTALTTSFMAPDPEDPHIEYTLDRGELLDDDSIWQRLDERCDLALRTEMHDHARYSMLKCFAHALHLAVNEVLQKTDCILFAVLKVCRLASATRTSCEFTELLKRNGTDLNQIVPNTRKWDDTLRNIQAIISCDFRKLSELCADHSGLDKEEFELLAELVALLQPFLEASNQTKHGINHTISVIVPTVLALYKHLINFRTKTKFLYSMATDLADSVYRHFQGVFAHVGMTGADTDEAADVHDFGESIYIQAAVLDPTFGLQWLRDVHADEDAKSILRKRILDDVLMESESRFCFEDSDSFRISENEGPPHKAMRLFAHYKKKMDQSEHAIASAQLKEYLEMVDKGCEGRTCFQFWTKYKSKFNLLYPLARRVLAIPASSTAVEQVFAKGGIVTKQRQAALDDHTLSHLVFLKSNANYQFYEGNSDG